MPVFSESQSKKKDMPIINEIVRRVNDNTKRLRLLEQRERLLTSRTSSMDESSFQKIKDISAAISELKTGLAAQDEKISALQNNLRDLAKQLGFLATKTDLKKLDEKLRLYEPLIAELASGADKQES